jgi:predicted phage terminase large subunit-like protein
LIEDKASGTALIQELSGTKLPHVPYPIPIEPEADKMTRAAQQSAAIEAGHVYLPRKADWLNELRNELVQFPFGRYDDQVDSITQFLKWVRTREIWPTHIEVIWPT